MKYFNVAIFLFCLLAIGASVMFIMDKKIVAGVIVLLFPPSIGLIWQQFIRNKKVVFMDDYVQIPMDYVQQGVPFSKTIIPYKGLILVEFIEVQDVENDCVDIYGKKVPCIKFVDKEGEIYRMKVDLFSDSQAFWIIDETKRRAGIVEEENALE